MIFFTADQHFGHENIIRYCHRPFSTVEQMDHVMIDRWNELVRPGDTVYHLGDFTLLDKSAARQYFARLNGIIYVLYNPWHHDKRWLPTHNRGIVPDCGTLQGIAIGLRPPIHVLEFPELGDGKHPLAVVLCHYPLAEWERKHYGSIHLHGHSHGKYHAEDRIWDIGVDANHFMPVSLDLIYARMTDGT